MNNARVSSRCKRGLSANCLTNGRSPVAPRDHIGAKQQGGAVGSSPDSYSGGRAFESRPCHTEPRPVSVAGNNDVDEAACPGRSPKARHAETGIGGQPGETGNSLSSTRAIHKCTGQNEQCLPSAESGMASCFCGPRN